MIKIKIYLTIRISNFINYFLYIERIKKQCIMTNLYTYIFHLVILSTRNIYFMKSND